MSHKTRNLDLILCPAFPWIRIMLMFPTLDLTGISSAWQSSTQRFTHKFLVTNYTFISKIMVETSVQKRPSFKNIFNF